MHTVYVYLMWQAFCFQDVLHIVDKKHQMFSIYVNKTVILVCTNFSKQIN